MKKNLLIGGLIVLLGGFLASTNAQSRGRKSADTTATFMDEGDEVTPFAISCSSQSWTVLAASDTIRRTMVAEWIPTNASMICVSTITTSGYSCGNTTPGVELSSSTIGFTDNSRVKWNCRSRASDATISVLKGYTARDSGDLGAINR